MVYLPRIQQSKFKHAKVTLNAMKFMRPEANSYPQFGSQFSKSQDRGDQSLKYLEKFQLSLDNILQSGRDIYPEQFRQVFSEQIKEKLQPLGDQYLDLKIDIFVSRVKVLQMVARAQEGAGSFYSRQREPLAMPADVFRSLAREGHNLRNTLEKRFMENEILNEVLFWMDSYSRKLDNKIREIHSATNSDTLERMPRIVLGFLDLSQEFDERRALLADENFNFSQRPQQRAMQSQQMKPFASRSFNAESSQYAEKPSFNSQRFRDEEFDNFEKHASRSNQQREFLRPIENTLPMSQPKMKDQMNSNLPIEKNSKRSFAMVTIREIIQNSGSSVTFDNITAVNLAQQIVDEFPHLNQDREKLEEFCTFLKRLMKYPNVYRGLALKSFPSKLISKLFTKTTEELTNLERKLSSDVPSRQQTEQATKSTRNEFPSEIPDGRAIKKKVKRDYSNKRLNMVHESIANSHKQLRQKNPMKNSLVETLLKGMGIEENKLLKSTKTNENLLRSGLSNSNRNRTSYTEFSPLKDQNDFDDGNQFTRHDDFRMAGEFGENFDDEDDAFSNSGRPDFNRNFGDFGGSFKESHRSPRTKNSEHRSKNNRAPILYDPDEDDDDLGLSDLDLTVDDKKTSKSTKASNDSIFQVYLSFL